MSTYYLFDMHVPVISDARLVDVVTTSADAIELRVDGLTPIKVPEGVRVINPTSLTDLLEQKYAGLLAQYPGFGSIIYDSLLDATGIQPPSSDDLLPLTKTGSRSTIGGPFKSSLLAPGMDVSPSVISQCVLVYEHYTWRYVDPRDGRVERYYVEESDQNLSSVSVNGGATFQTTTSGSLVSFLPGDQGSVLQVSLLEGGSTLSNNRLICTGSWAVIY